MPEILTSSGGKITDNRGSVTVMTLFVTALAAIWLSTMLVMASNNERTALNRLEMAQSRHLAESAFVAGRYQLQEMVAQGGLPDQPDLALLSREGMDTAGVGTMTAVVQAMPGQPYCKKLVAVGEAGSCRSVVTGDFVLLEGSWFLPESPLPVCLFRNPPTLTRQFMHDGDCQAVVLSDSKDKITIYSTSPVAGGLHFRRTVDGALTVQVESALAALGPVLIEGTLALNQPLTAAELVVTGDLRLGAKSRLDCGRIVVYGDVYGAGISSYAGELALGGRLLTDSGQPLPETEAAYTLTDALPEIPPPEQRLYLERVVWQPIS